MTLDDRFAAGARVVPGFAGILFEAGQLVVMAVPGAPEQELREMVKALLSLSGRGANADALVNTMQVRTARYGFDELLQWKRDLDPLSLNLDIHSVDIDERENALRLGTMTGTPEEIEAVLVGQGVPAEAILVEKRAYSVPDNLLENHYRPVFAGLKVGVGPSSGGCTLGSVVNHVDAQGNSSSTRYVVTASHCTQTFGALDGDTIGQPSTSSPIGVEIYDSTAFTYAEDSNCPQSTTSTTIRCRYSDAALFEMFDPNDGYLWHFSPNISTDIWGQPVMEVDWFDTDDNSFIGDDVRMAGQVSGHEDGTVSGTCVDHKQYTDGGAFLYRIILCTSDASYSRDKGDSGGPVFRYDMPAETWTLVGIHYGSDGNGGGTFANMTFVGPELLPIGWGGGLCFSEFSLQCFQ